MADNTNFEAIIIGGSYAGLSAAMALGRSLRKVLIIDSGLPCNRQTPHAHNFITQDGATPGAIREIAKKQVLNYSSIRFLEDSAMTGKKLKSGFLIETESGKEFIAQKLILATGITDIMPDIKGFSDCWGISVVHCPYCHGYEFRNRKTGILADVEKAMHLAPLVKNLTDDLTIFTSDKANFTTEQIRKLTDHDIKIMDAEISEVEHQEGHIQNVVFKNGKRIPFECVYAALPFKQHSEIPEALGCELTEQGHVMVNFFQKTSVEGVFACGDNSGMMRSVANAVYSGNLTGAMVNTELAMEQFE